MQKWSNKNLPKAGDGMLYIAKKDFQETPTRRIPVGTPVPEAFGWRKMPVLLRRGFLEFYPTRLPEPPKTHDPGLSATASTVAAPSQSADTAALKSGADPLARPTAPKHGKARGAPA